MATHERPGNHPVPGAEPVPGTTSPDDVRRGPDHRCRVTTDHEVIRRWAEQRDAHPATILGTAPDDRVGVLRLDLPGYGSRNLRHVGWDEWFAAFDARRLDFVYQDRRSDGSPSNFFRLESPDGPGA